MVEAYGGSGAGLVVAAADAPAAVKGRADLVCTGQVVGGAGDEALINRALTQARTVYLSDGMFEIASPIEVTRDGTALVGAGAGSAPGDTTSGGGTTLRISRAANERLTNGYLIEVSPSDADRPLARVQIAHLCVHGAGKLGTAIGGILFRGYDGLVEQVRAVTLSGDGIRFIGAASGWMTYNTTAFGCVAGWNGGYGIALDDRQAADQHLIHCVVNNNGRDGLYLGGSSHQVTGLHAYANQGYGVRLTRFNANSKLVNCKLEHNAAGGLAIEAGASGTQLGTCGFRGNRGSAILVGGRGDLLVHGCRFDPRGDDGTAFGVYALDFAADPAALIDGNLALPGWTSGAAVRFQSSRDNVVFGTNIGLGRP